MNIIFPNFLISLSSQQLKTVQAYTYESQLLGN